MRVPRRIELPRSIFILGGAARAASVDHLVRSLPKGYDTMLTDETASVSAGERQLLTIARAFIADPPILILDEATSHLDNESEMLVQKALANLMTGRTVIVIAHRISTVRRADVIVVLQGGCVVEMGSHGELLRRGGEYERLFRLQAAGFVEE
mgnify:CR=1 FL=1